MSAHNIFTLERPMQPPIHILVQYIDPYTFVWVGEEPARFDTLSVAYPDNSPSHMQPAAKMLMGSLTDDTGLRLASKLAQRLGKPVMVSWQLSNDDSDQPDLLAKLFSQISL